MPQLSLKNASVVLLGVFDVRSFTPTALLRTEILTPSEAVKADAITIVPNRASQFDFDGIKVMAQNDRVQVVTSAPPYIRAADIVSKAIRENAQFPTRVVAVGINVHAYFMMDSFEERDRVGRKLAPISVWGEWSKQLEQGAAYSADDPRHSGMTSLVMKLPNHDDRDSGWIEVRVEPSARVKGPEVFVSVNDHYGLPLDTAKADATDKLALLGIAETRFDSSMQRAEAIFASVLSAPK